VTCSPVSGSTFPIGTTTVTCTASDTRGNSSSRSFPVTLTQLPDNHPPAFGQLPQSRSVEATSSNGAVVSIQILVSDAEGPGTFQCTGGAVASFPYPSTGPIAYTVSLPLGATEIECSATDTSGNTFIAGTTFSILVVPSDGRPHAATTADPPARPPLDPDPTGTSGATARPPRPVRHG
jgi:hypothetical protein